MRTIKFRAWDKQQGRWLTIDMYTADSITAMARRVTGIDWFLFPDSCNPDIELMQYTGLKDEQDKEIYEGDIALMVALNGEKIYTEVCWEIDVAQFRLNPINKSGQDYIKNAWDLDRRIEVIGNIYENPELLEG